MPTLAQAISNNQKRRAVAGPKPEPIVRGPITLPMSAPAPITFQPAPELPLRSTFPPELYAADHVTAGSQPQRLNSRSSVWSQPESITGNSVPGILSNKRLIAPIIGGGGKLNRYNKLVTTLTPASVGATSQATQIFSVGGVQPTDKVWGYQWGIAQKIGVVTLAVRVTGTGKIAVDFYNPTGGSLTPTGGNITLFLGQ